MFIVYDFESHLIESGSASIYIRDLTVGNTSDTKGKSVIGSRTLKIHNNVPDRLMNTKILNNVNNKT